MGFKAKVTPSDFVKGPEKDALIEGKVPFEILKIRFSAKGRYGPQHYLKIRKIDGTLGTMTFSSDGTVFSRDDLLDQAMAYLDENPDDTLVARLRHEGQTNIIDIEQD